MRFFGSDGILARSRRYVSGNANVQEDEVKDASKLAEIIRGIFRRLSEVEALVPPEAIEFEVELAGTTSVPVNVTLSHNMHTAVRYSVVFWTSSATTGTYPSAAAVLVADESSDDDNLVLQAYSTGRAVVRVEPSFRGLAFGKK